MGWGFESDGPTDAGRVTRVLDQVPIVDIVNEQMLVRSKEVRKYC